eukprot:CAMPEP_0196824842 /NCGR_PEP_ID=MMETSP1362-20130617/92719_1 /TAXON_ID=163516 /ORGANISM="Leptocylindrus danicus, Strain CCMP1856" /LENGTH=190 /DNA_ID=CAMNT_0042205191 /DNA_START=101 /DNA_END=673 /DNA_ORIENTATION=+
MDYDLVNQMEHNLEIYKVFQLEFQIDFPMDFLMDFPMDFLMDFLNLLGIITSPSFRDDRITLEHTSLLTMKLETHDTKRTGHIQRKFIIHTTLNNGHLGSKLGQQLGNATGINLDKTHGTLLGTASNKELGHALGFFFGSLHSLTLIRDSDLIQRLKYLVSSLGLYSGLYSGLDLVHYLEENLELGLAKD